MPWSSWFCPFLLVLAAAPAQSPAPTPEPAPVSAPLHVGIIGASLSAGFVDGPLTGGTADNHTTALQKVVRGWLGEGGKVQSRAEVAMFTNPLELGEKQLTKALKDDPDLLLAIDFLFWYGYGYAEGREPEAKAKVRQERLEIGLALLARWEKPVVIGDLPDMHGADPHMLSPAQIPSVEVLGAMNERIAGWAKARKNVRLLPLRPLVLEMKQQGVKLPLASGAVEVPPGGLLQSDHLHPNRLGMAWLGFVLQQPVRAALPAAAVALLPRCTIEQFVGFAGADGDLADLQPAAKAGAGR